MKSPRTPMITHKIMSSIKSKNTKPESILAKTMWANGLRFRKHFNIIGKPDFVFIRAKVAVFCDGDFWHGNNWKIRKLKSFEEELTGYSDFWKNKILKNIERDKMVNVKLNELGWLVLRFWESDIKKDVNSVLKVIKETVSHSKIAGRLK